MWFDPEAGIMEDKRQQAWERYIGGILTIYERYTWSVEFRRGMSKTTWDKSSEQREIRIDIGFAW